MGINSRLAQLFNLNNEGWMRHASPWSVWTRVFTLPVIVFAFWSRVWLGWWSLVPIAIVILWTWINPVIFPSPKSTSNWASKGVLGERVWLNRRKIPIPRHHLAASYILTTISLLGTILLAYGVIFLQIWPTLLGTALAYLGKMWFVDRMVWLYEDMKDVDPEYRSWLYDDST